MCVDLFGGFAVNLSKSELHVKVIVEKGDNEASATLCPNSVDLGVCATIAAWESVGVCIVQFPAFVRLVQIPLPRLLVDDVCLTELVVQLLCRDAEVESHLT